MYFKIKVNCKHIILNTYATQFDDCTKDVLKELHHDVQEEEMSDSDEESAEVEDK